MKASEKMGEMYDAMVKLYIAGAPISEEEFSNAWHAQMRLLPRALPSLISIVAAVEALQPDLRSTIDSVSWDDEIAAEIAAARYQALRALTSLERDLSDD